MINALPNEFQSATYRTVLNPVIAYRSQAEGLTTYQPVALPGPIKILESYTPHAQPELSLGDKIALSKDLYSRAFCGGPPPPTYTPAPGQQRLDEHELEPFSDKSRLEPDYPMQLVSEDVELLDYRAPILAGCPTLTVAAKTADELSAELLDNGMPYLLADGSPLPTPRAEPPVNPQSSPGQQAASSQDWKLSDDTTYIVGNTPNLQAFATAVQANHLFETYLANDLDYRHSPSSRVCIRNAEASALRYGPNSCGSDINVFGQFATSDPDVIAHEFGHSFLTAYFEFSTLDSFTASAHEAFADVTAFVSALRHQDVREDILLQRAKGSSSNLATNIAEGYNSSKMNHGQQIDLNTAGRSGIRDISAPPPQGPEKPNEECHESSLRFSHGLYCALLKIEQQTKAQLPYLSNSQALRLACERVTADFIQSTTFLSPTDRTFSQSTLAQAVIQANTQYRNGEQAAIYRQCFRESYLSV